MLFCSLPLYFTVSILFVCTCMFIVTLGAILKSNLIEVQFPGLETQFVSLPVFLSNGALYSSIFPYCHNLIIISALLLSI